MIEVADNNRRHIVTDLMPDLTPLLDVMFMLIVFFILTANAVPYALDINLPEDTEAVTQVVNDPDMLSITLLPDEQWKINDQVYTSEQNFKAELKRKIQDSKQVIIIGDKEASMQKLLSVMAVLRKYDIEAADIVMEQR